MDINMILKALYIIAMLALGGLVIWYKGNATLRGAVAALIAEAERAYRDSTKAGGEKFAWVVNSIYAMLPKPLQAIVRREMIEQIVQGTFDAMANYAKQQLDKVADRVQSQLNSKGEPK